MSADHRWLKTASALAAKMAEQAGFPAEAAREIGDAVEAAASAIIEGSRNGAEGDLQMSYATGARGFEVGIDYQVGPTSQQLSDALTESHGAGARAALESMDAVEVTNGEEGARHCRLIRRLP